MNEFLASLELQRGATIRLLYLLDDDDPSPEHSIRLRFPGAQRLPIPGGHGLPTAYFKLLESAPLDSDYYCFADQDDVWLPEKLDHALSELCSFSHEPALWVSRIQPFRELDGRRFLQPVLPRALPRLSWRHALVESAGPGCAMVWNQELQHVLSDAGQHRGIVMHDWWIYAVASITGRVLLEPNPQVLYRLHASNAVGIDNSLASRVRRLVERPSSSPPDFTSQAQALLEVFKHRMTPEQASVAADIASGERVRRFLRAMRGHVYRTRRAEYPLLCGRMLWR